MVNVLISSFHRNNTVCLQFLLQRSAIYRNRHAFNHLLAITLVTRSTGTFVFEACVFGPLTVVREERIEIILVFLTSVHVKAQGFQIADTFVAGFHTRKNNFLYRLALTVCERQSGIAGANLNANNITAVVIGTQYTTRILIKRLRTFRTATNEYHRYHGYQ